jgi:hypothetical protein
MIQPHRAAHRRIWLLLAILLPVLFAAAVVMRHQRVLPEEPPERAPAAERAR